MSSSANKVKKYILFKERNGWEQETFFTFIPLEGNKKGIRTLMNAADISNKKSAKKDAEKKEEWAARDRQEAQYYAKYGQPPPPPIHLGCTYFEFDRRKPYTEEEARTLCKQNRVGYMQHHIVGDTTFATEPLKKLEEWVKNESADEIYDFLYKGGVVNLF